MNERQDGKVGEMWNGDKKQREGRLHMCVCLTPCSEFVYMCVRVSERLLCAPLTCNSNCALIKFKINHNHDSVCVCVCTMMKWVSLTVWGQGAVVHVDQQEVPGDSRGQWGVQWAQPGAQRGGRLPALWWCLPWSAGGESRRTPGSTPRYLQ